MAWERERQRGGQAFNSQKSYWWEAVLTHPLDAGWTGTRCAKLQAGFREHGKGRSSFSFPPGQTVLNEKDKFGGHCSALWTSTYGLSEEMTHHAKQWPRPIQQDCFGTPLPHAYYVHPWVDSKIPITQEFSGMSPWYHRGRNQGSEKWFQELVPEDKAHQVNCFSRVPDSNIHSSVQIEYSAHRFCGFPGLFTWYHTRVLKHLEHMATRWLLQQYITDMSSVCLLPPSPVNWLSQYRSVTLPLSCLALTGILWFSCIRGLRICFLNNFFQVNFIHTVVWR